MENQFTLAARSRRYTATDGWSPENQNLNRAENVLAFFVSDTGIGIPLEKQTTIFEPFLQADGSFVLSEAFMRSLAGGTLSDGQHVLHLISKDSTGKQTAASFVVFMPASGGA